MKVVLLALTSCLHLSVLAQTFNRSEIDAGLSIPWEIMYGPDDYLWLSDVDGQIVRVHPETGVKQVVHQADDYFAGDPSENLTDCFNPPIQYGTLGMTMHPDFLDPDSSYIYLYYSYNAGDLANPSTNFKIRRLKWDVNSLSVTDTTDIVTNIPSSHDHIGGRLKAYKRQGKNYLFLTIGDYGISEDNAPDCYPDQSLNPNNFTADITTWNGKTHRFNMDGSIPSDNPVSGNSMYTRGHRNPQGLMYNDHLDILYNVEHGDRTDDEINVLHAGMNYGWKSVRGYHDGNHPGELSVVNAYQGEPLITSDSLVEAFYSWCDSPVGSSGTWSDWCTVAPSGGIYYGSTGIPQWTNSLLVVTLKDGVSTDKEVFQFKLDWDGNLVPSTSENPNPQKFFGQDQDINGRLRDIAISKDGKKIFLINNFGAATNKIIVYTVDESSLPAQTDCFSVFPNPTENAVSIVGTSIDASSEVEYSLWDLTGRPIRMSEYSKTGYVDLTYLQAGTYYIKVNIEGVDCTKKIVKL